MHPGHIARRQQMAVLLSAEGLTGRSHATACAGARGIRCRQEGSRRVCLSVAKKVSANRLTSVVGPPESLTKNGASKRLVPSANGAEHPRVAGAVGRNQATNRGAVGSQRI